MQDRLNGIDTFVLVAESGSFSAAAQRLHLSRSAVSKTVARLEQRLGARLFQRTTRRQALTADGQAFYEHCARALSELSLAEAALDSGRREPSGRLRVSVPVLFGRQWVAPILLRLADRHPRLSVEISFSDRVADLVEEGFDFAIRIGRIGDSASLVARRLGRQRMAICAAPSYLERFGRPEAPEDFAGHRSIVYGRANSDFAWRILDREDAPQTLRLDNRIRLDDLQAIADAAVAGVGLAWLPCWLLTQYVRRGELELVLSSERVPSHDIHLVWPKAHYMPSKTRSAIDALLAEATALE